MRWITGARHWSYTDQQIILPQLAACGLISAERSEKAVGSIDPARSVQLQRDYLSTYFDAVFSGADIDTALWVLLPQRSVHAPRATHHTRGIRR